MFWPSAVLTSYAAFTVSNFIVGYGLSCLEVAANPYIALCGPLEYAEFRLNLSQAFQAIGTVCSPLLATKVLFKSVNSAGSLVDVQWAYLGIALFVFGLAVVFYYIPLPEASDDQLEELAEQRSDAYSAKVGPWKVIYVTLGIGVFSQFCYVGAQECVGNNVQPLFRLLKPNSSLQPFDYQMVGHGVFAAGRFLVAVMNLVLKPRRILLGLYVALIICLALDMRLSGNGGAAIPMLSLFFEAGIFAIIFAIAMRGLGKHTKTGAAFVTAAISGGAVFPPIQWAVAKGHGLKYSYCVPLAVAVLGALFAIYLNLVPAAKNQVDPVRDRHLKRRAASAASQGSNGEIGEKTSGQNRLPSFMTRMNKNRQSVSPSVEHLERQGTNMSADCGLASPVLRMDFADEKNNFVKEKPVQMKQSKGQVGDLALWPVEEDASEATASSSSGSNGPHSSNGKGQDQSHAEQEMTITRHRPQWEGGDSDDDIDDYHAMMRKI